MSSNYTCIIIIKLNTIVLCIRCKPSKQVSIITHQFIINKQVIPVIHQTKRKPSIVIFRSHQLVHNCYAHLLSCVHMLLIFIHIQCTLKGETIALACSSSTFSDRMTTINPAQATGYIACMINNTKVWMCTYMQIYHGM